MRKEWRDAAIAGNAGTVERLLAEGELIDGLDRYGQTALMLAATRGHATVIDQLLACDADLDIAAKYGLTALMLAIVNRHTDIAAALLTAGADTALRGAGAPGFADKTAGRLARDGGMSGLANQIALGLIARTFAGRTRPSEITDSKQLSDVEYDEVMSFDGIRWQDVTFAQIEQNSDAVFWFSPEAFRYYLPGLMSAGIKENRCDANCYDALIGMLDRSPEPDYWDDFFLSRWPLLTALETIAVAEWVDWLESLMPDGFHGNSYNRARETLLLLATRQE